MAPTFTPRFKTNPITCIDLDDHAPLDVSRSMYDALCRTKTKITDGMNPFASNSRSSTAQQELSVPPEMKVFSGTNPATKSSRSPHASQIEHATFTFSSPTALETKSDMEDGSARPRKAFRRSESPFLEAESESSTERRDRSRHGGRLRHRRPSTPVPAPASSSRIACGNVDHATPDAHPNKPSNGKHEVERPRRRRWPNCHCKMPSELVQSGGQKFYRCEEGECVFRQRVEDEGTGSGWREIVRGMRGMRMGN